MPKGSYVGKRSTITLPDDVDDIFNRAAVLWGKPKATVLRDLLVEAAPQLLELVKASDDIKNGASGALNRAGAIFLNQLSEALAELASDSLKTPGRAAGSRAPGARVAARRGVGKASRD